MSFNETLVSPEQETKKVPNEVQRIVSLMELPDPASPEYEILEEAAVLNNLGTYLTDNERLLAPSFEEYLQELDKRLSDYSDYIQFENSIAANEIVRQRNYEALTQPVMATNDGPDRFMQAKLYARKIREIIEEARKSDRTYGQILMAEAGRLTLRRAARSQISERT